MDFRRNGLRDERRRRVLIEETLHGEHSRDASGADSSPPSGGRHPVKTYSDAALASSQLPITFLLPKRPLLTWSILFAGLAVVGSIQLLYRYVFLLADESLRPSLIAFDVTARGSLASWFAGTVLSGSAFVSLLIFLIRRHRTDDYRGRYRWWLWLVPLLLLFSVCATTGLHQVVSGVLTAASRAEVASGGKGWWMLTFAAILIPLVPQLTWEMWVSRMATAFFAATLTAYLVVALFELNAVQLATPLATIVAHSTLLSAAHLGLFVTVLAYGRYVYLDAHGRLGERRSWVRWPKRVKAVAQESTADKPASSKSAASSQVRIDGAHSKFGQENAPTRPPTIQNDDHDHDHDHDHESSSDRKLSKAERRRQRREGQVVQPRDMR